MADEPQEVEEAQEPVEEVEEPTEEDALENSKNPERTKEYIEKLKEDKKEVEKKYEDALESLKPKNVPQPQAPLPEFDSLSKDQVKSVYDSLVDDKGYIDENILKQELKRQNELVKQMAQENDQLKRQFGAQWQQIKNQQDNTIRREVYEKHPTLNPENENFNPDYWEAVRDKLVSQMVTTGQEDYLGAADKLAKTYEGGEEVKKADKEKFEAGENARRQINATGGASKQTKLSSADLDDLKKRSFKGDMEAIGERLKRSGF